MCVPSGHVCVSAPAKVFFINFSGILNIFKDKSRYSAIIHYVL